MFIYLAVIFWLGVGCLIYTYFIYPLFLIIITKLISSNNPPDYNLQDLPKVSFVVAAYNEEKVIHSKIENFKKVDYPDDLLEIWIASDGSSDRTNEIVLSLAEHDKRINLLALPRTGKSGVINKVVPKTNYDILIFSDANTEFKPDAVKKLVKYFLDPEIGCVSGRLSYRNPGNVVSGEGESFYWRYETALKKMESKLGYVAGANGAIYAVRKQLFEPLPSGTINDDFETSMKIVEKGYKNIYEENAIAYEDVAPTVESEFKRHIRDGAGHYIAIMHLLRLLNIFIGIKSFIYWSHRILRWLAPFIMIFLLIINMLLIQNTFYKIIFILQISFYILALMGLLNVNNKKMPFFLYVPFYFCNLNLALLLGFLRVITGKQKTTWERTERA